MPNQQGDIFRPFPQRRHVYRKNIQAIEKVSAEYPLLHHGGQVPVSGGDQPRAGPEGARVSQALKLPLLQHSQKLGLRFQRDFTDFVKENGSPVG